MSFRKDKFVVFYHDDPEAIEPPSRRKRVTSAFSRVAALVATVFFLQTTLASNISINSGGPIQFGQGIMYTVACDSSLQLTPRASFINSSGAGFFGFSGVTLSNLNTTTGGCADKTLTFSAYNVTGDAITTFSIFFSGGNFYSGDGSLLDISGQGTTSSSVTLTFTTPTVASTDVYRITIQSSLTPPQASFTGSPSVALPFVASTGDWPSGTTLAYQWQSSTDGTNGWTNLTSASATTASYTPVRADVNKFLRLKERNTVTSEVSYSLPSNTVGSLISNGDFTIEMWVKATAGFTTTGRQELFSYKMDLWPYGGHRFDITYGDGDGYWDIYTSENGWISISTTPAVIGTWYHVAVTRKNGELVSFFDGVKSSAHPSYNISLSATGEGYFCLGADVYWGCYSGGANVAHGLMANLRVVNGFALYQNNFTPSVAVPTRVAGTTFLLSEEISSPSTLVFSSTSYYVFVPPAGSGLIRRGSATQEVSETPTK